MINIDTLTLGEFRELPLVVEGESKEVRYAGEGRVVIRLKPTIYSFTHNRAGEIPGSDRARLRVIQRLLPVLQSAGIRHTYEQVNDKWIVSTLVLQPDVVGAPPAFRPSDLTPHQLRALPRATPLEVVVKRRHSGTPKHRYYQFDSYPTKGGGVVAENTPYPSLVVRFDWRNPMYDEMGNRLADEVLPEDMAMWFINVKASRRLAVRAFGVLETFFAGYGMELWDLCFFIDESGEVLFGEVSPDGMRIRSGARQLDKDVWRAGGSSELVLQKWQELARIIEK